MGGSADDAIDIPDFIKASKTVWTLDYNHSTKAKIDDNLCVFRAIAASQLNTFKGLESKTMELFRLYIHGTQQNVTEFTGIELTDFPNTETFCSVNCLRFGYLFYCYFEYKFNSNLDLDLVRILED